jgi:hypothetical protein
MPAGFFLLVPEFRCLNILKRNVRKLELFHGPDRLSRQSQWSPILFFSGSKLIFQTSEVAGTFCKSHPIEQDEYDKRETIPLATVT